MLRLLGTDLGGPDIARELVVSLNTVRTHTKNIYTKLGVNNRRAAVRRAEELDLLPRARNRRTNLTARSDHGTQLVLVRPWWPLGRHCGGRQSLGPQMCP